MTALAVNCQTLTYRDFSNNAVKKVLSDGSIKLDPGRTGPDLNQRNASTSTNEVKTNLPGEGLYNSHIIHETGSWPESVALGDLNNDGLRDVVMCTSSYFSSDDNTVFVFLQNTNGTLMPPAKYKTFFSNTVSLAVGDFNNDGRSDVVVGGTGGSGILYQNAGGTLNPITSFNPGQTRYVNSGDFNSDGLDDIVSMDWGSGSVLVSLQNPAGGMSPAVSYVAGHAGYDELEVGDLNNDGRDDIIVMSGQAYAVDNVAVLLQSSSGTMMQQVNYDVGGDVNSNAVGVGDVTGDGRNDLIISYYNRLAVFAQNETGQLSTTPIVYESGGGTAVVTADLNLDGRTDVVSAPGGDFISVVIQSPSGTLNLPFDYASPYATRFNPRGIVVGDINRDGGPDIVMANYNYGLVIYYHTPVHTAVQNGWELYD